MIALVLRFIFFFVVLIGFIQFYFVRLKIKSEFIPVIVFSSIGLLMFFAGLLNVLLEVLVLLVVASLTYLIYAFITKEWTVSFLTPGMYYFFIFTVYLAFFLNGAKFVAYDDFSHWGLVAREILSTNKFPNFESLIVFQSYPTGSASFIYFVSKLIGNTEGVMLFAQSILVVSGIIPLFAFINKNKGISYGMIFLATTFFLTSNVGFLALSVDTLLSILSLAASAIILYYFINEENKWFYMQLVPILSFLMIVKNSGILFVLINGLLFFYCSLKSEKSRLKSIKIALFLVGIPYSVKFLWEKHVQLVFSKGFESKHAMSAENYKTIVDQKSVADIQLIVKKFIARSIDMSQIDIKIGALCLLFFLLTVLLIKWNVLSSKGEVDLGLKLFISSLILYYIYQLSLLFMYLFSMPLSEALVLASYERYNMTMIMYIYGLSLLYLFLLLSENKIRPLSSPSNGIVLFFCILVLVLPVYWKYPIEKSLFIKGEYSQNDRKIVETVFNKNNLSKDEKYLIYLSDQPEINWASYFYYVSLYALHSADIKMITNETINEIDLTTVKTNLIILRDDVLMNEKLKSKGIVDYTEIVTLN
ncbi:hypothetical protein [Carnobacterium sp. TMP28]|uniref:hypothetical protein n=1 Tax=Carnobacterium sp. TMP28 TaxID=3397060 RepID=UPI0039E0DA7B